MNSFVKACLVSAITILVLSGPLGAKANKGEATFKNGQAAEQRQDWDRALEFYLQALDQKPNDPVYLIAMRRARFQAGQKHVDLGQKLRSRGELESAMGEFQKALIADPSSSIAVQEMKRTEHMLEAASNRPAGQEGIGLTPVERARRENQERNASILSLPELKPPLHTVGPLKINNQPPKVIFETIGKLAGVDVLFDSQYTAPPRGVNVELGVTTPERAFDYVAILTHTFWKAVSEDAIFVAEDNPTKHRDFDDEVVRTFYVTNATSAQEFQEIATAVRTVTDIRRVFTYTAQKAMVVRGSADAVALAAKVLQDLDKPKSEVVIDVIVMQANSTRTRDLAASLVNSSGTAGLSVPINFTPRNPVTTSATSSSSTTTTTTTSTSSTSSSLVSLAGVGHISSADFATTLPGALLNMMLSDSRTKILNSPTMRVSDGMKATLKIGQRIPYATGSYQAGVSSTVSPLVSTQFNYADVGVNVEMTPQVHSNSEVTLHVEVEVSSVAQYVSIGGISQPVIGQNKNSADIRLKEGEVNILGGLSSAQDSKSVSGIPGLVDMPVLGNTLFGSQHTEKDRGELMIALVPHIVRTPDYDTENFRGIYAGNDNTVKLYYAAKDEARPSAPSPQVATGPAVGQAGAGQAGITFVPSSVDALVGDAVNVVVHVDNQPGLDPTATIRIKFDATQLRLNDIGPGDVFTRGGQRVSSVKDIRNDGGEALLTVSEPSGSLNPSQTGILAVLNFVAIGRGSSTITLLSPSPRNAQGQPLPVASELPVKVR